MKAALLCALSLLCVLASAKRFILPTLPPHSLNTAQVHDDSPFHFTVHLRQQNIDLLEKTFWQVSDPNHEKYGRHWSKKQVDDLVAPKQESIDKVAEWLQPLNNNSQIFFGKTFVSVATSAKQASQLFETKLHHDFDPQTKRNYIRSQGDASIPMHLKEHVHLVTGLYRTRLTARIDDLENIVRGITKRDPAVPYDDTFTASPPQIRQYYDIKHTSVSNAVVTQAVFAYQDEYYPQALQSFASTYATNPNVQNIPGLLCSLSNCEAGESDLDIQYITAIGQNAKTYFIGYFANNGFFLETLEILLPQTPTIPMAMSVSYGATEANLCPGGVECDSTDYADVDYLVRTDIELMKLGVIGATVLVATGDNGAPGINTNGFCPTNNNYYCLPGGCQYTSSSCQGALVTFSNNDGVVQFVWPISVEYSVPTSVANAFLNDNANCEAALDGPNSNAQNLLHSTCTCSQLSYKTYSTGGSQFRFSRYDPILDAVPNPGFFTPSYPASSPYVTAVGATIIKEDGSGNLYEAAAATLNGAAFSSGGGFSYFYTQPSYQQSAVNAWYNSAAAANPNLYNISNRAYPDISFVGHNFPVTTACTSSSSSSCSVRSIGGTSASTPTLAGMVTLINDQLVSLNLPTVGFLNPIMYDAYSKQPSIFRDVTQGDNFCTEQYCCLYGFNATTGWDPATGLGSFDHAAMSTYIIAAKTASGAKFNANNFASPYTPASGASVTYATNAATTAAAVTSMFAWALFILMNV